MAPENKDGKKDKESEVTKKPHEPKKETKPAKAAASKKKEADNEAAGTKAKAPSPPKAKKPAGESQRRPLAPATYFAKPGSVVSDWKLIDASNLPLGRLSSYVAHLLMGKAKAAYTRSANTGDHVVVVNAEKVVLTGNKWRDKVYQYHTNYPGGIKTLTAQEILARQPERLIKWAVHGMLPKGHMGRRWYKNLLVYVGSEHPHKAQQPEAVKLPNLGIHERT